MAEYTYDERLVSDLHKDAYGFRPREGWWEAWATAGDAGRQEIWDDLCRDLELAVESERERALLMVQDFENRIDQIERCGVHRATAIRWLVDSLPESELEVARARGVDHLLWYLELPDRYGPEIAAACDLDGQRTATHRPENTRR